MGLPEYLEHCDKRYSEDNHLLGGPFYGPGYHSRVTDGTYVHDIVNSLNYAIALLEAGGLGNVERAACIVRKVLTLQDTDPTSPTYGIWPWLLEEPLSAMSSPDWNWADFGGVRLAQMLKDYGADLPEEAVRDMKASLAHAAWSVFRRNMPPSYTNIAIMGAGVAVAAGELLNTPRLLDYGRRRLHKIVEHTKFHGGFNEYNSPAYTMVALHECERILDLVKDATARAEADWLRRVAWLTIAEHWHPGTCQWAGPHSRAYTLRLGPATVRYFSEQTGVEIQPYPTTGPERPAPPPQFPELPCPKKMAPRFRALPEKETEVKRRFIKREPDGNSVWGTTWLSEDACLGSVNMDNLWAQRHAVLAYWRTPEDPAVVLRLRFLHDDRDFASAFVRSAQAGPRVLSAISLLWDCGDFHMHLDRPADGLFEAGDFRVRYELGGQGVAAKALGDGRFDLSAGARRAVIHTVPGRFGPNEVRWTIGNDQNRAWVDGLCYSGPRQRFDFRALGEVVIAAALELLGSDESPSAAPAVQPVDDGTYRVTWPVAGGLSLAVPTRVHLYPK